MLLASDVLATLVDGCFMAISRKNRCGQKHRILQKLSAQVEQVCKNKQHDNPCHVAEKCILFHDHAHTG